MQDFERELLQRLMKCRDATNEDAVRQAHAMIIEKSQQWTTDQKWMFLETVDGMLIPVGKPPTLPPIADMVKQAVTFFTDPSRPTLPKEIRIVAPSGAKQPAKKPAAQKSVKKRRKK